LVKNILSSSFIKDPVSACLLESKSSKEVSFLNKNIGIAILHKEQKYLLLSYK